ncbi:hypothetical protein HPB48_011864 [Haemaphysalis longicornis]|uniref:Uncharacterized protein n=1 Tax=Haemaphysalis longicornis TaxID=44386 RepID=A0A9J6FL80_HAELO|nr:hypothetical protein HPB48_011864 [Haemaphysalis longicornis]
MATRRAHLPLTLDAPSAGPDTGRFGRRDVVEHLLENGANVHAKDDGGLIPLHNACSFGHAEVVQLLLKHGADPNARDNWNYTPLHEAAIKGKVDVCIVLLQHGADAGIRNTDGKVPLDLADPSTRAVLTGDYRKDELLESARSGNEEKLLSLLTSINVNCHASDGRKSTPLHLAAGYNRVRIVQLLLQHGADVHAKDKGRERGPSVLFQEVQTSQRDTTFKMRHQGVLCSNGCQWFAISENQNTFATSEDQSQVRRMPPRSFYKFAPASDQWRSRACELDVRYEPGAEPYARYVGNENTFCSDDVSLRPMYLHVQTTNGFCGQVCVSPRSPLRLVGEPPAPTTITRIRPTECIIARADAKALSQKSAFCSHDTAGTA